MSRIALDRADSEPVAFDERLIVPADSLGEDVVSLDAVLLGGTISKAEEGYRIEGRFEGRAALRCVRCLESFPFELEEAVEIRLLPASQAPIEDDLQLAPRDLEVVFYDDPFADLAAIAVEQLQIAVPMKPLCSEDCRGLCSRCGADLNRGQCTCPEENDERWQPLAEWRPSN